MAESKLRPYGDVLTVTGKYTNEDGQDRNRYAKCGVLFATPHFSRVVIKLDTVPVNGTGWLEVKPREGTEDMKPPKDNLPNDDEVGKPADFDSVKF